MPDMVSAESWHGMTAARLLLQSLAAMSGADLSVTLMPSIYSMTSTRLLTMPGSSWGTTTCPFTWERLLVKLVWHLLELAASCSKSSS